MAGSYNHIITDQGNLGSPEFVSGMLETGGDVFEAVEEMYGMIWYLAVDHPDPAALVEHARQNYEKGLEFAKSVKDKGKH